MKQTAAGLAALGRGPDSLLVHMSPGEVQGLQQLAMAHGGSLTINPHTGLPEAGFLDKLLPTIIGAGLMMIPGMQGVAPWMIGAGVGGFEALRTGDIGKGLMAGLGAFGGAGLGSALGSMGANAAQSAAGNIGLDAANATMNQAGLTAAAQPLPEWAVNSEIQRQAALAGYEPTEIGRAIAEGWTADLSATTMQPYSEALKLGAMNEAAPTQLLSTAQEQALADRTPWTNVKEGFAQLGKPGGMSQLGTALMGPQGYGGKLGATAAGIGALGALGGFEQPKLQQLPGQERSTARLSGPIRRPYDPNAPEGYYFTDRGIIQPAYAAKGGEMHSVPQLEDGGFVLTKKAVDGMGKGSNERGQRAAAAGLGAIPIKGPGTGTSDSIKTSIDGVRPAKVSNGEAYVPKKRVKQAGGAKKLYALMRKAENDARRRAA